MFRRWIGAGALAAAIAAAPAPAAAVDMGLTPNEAYGLWSNINMALIAVPRYAPGGKALSSRVAEAKARESGKKTGGRARQHRKLHAETPPPEAGGSLRGSEGCGADDYMGFCGPLP